MAHFTFIAHGLTSPLNASLELGRRLTQSGHRVSYVSHADIGPDVEGSGFRFVQLTPEQSLRKTMASGIGRNPVAWVRQARRDRKASITNGEIERVVGDLDPDMLLIDIEMHYPVIATASLDIPTMLAMNWLSVFRLSDLPPLNTPIQPGDQEAIDRAWREVDRQAVGAQLKHKLGAGGIGDLLRPVSYGTRYYADLKQVARSRDYPLSDHTDRNQWLRPYMYTRLPVLCFNASELEFPHVPHPNIRYVGPMVNKNRREPKVGKDDAQKWEEYLRRRASAGQKRPMVYCSLGSYWSDQSFLSMVLATFAERHQWDLVLGLGGQLSPKELGPVSDNVTVLEYAPQLQVLAEADCAINHGGITSINECIANEVPMVVYSPGLLDQDGCASRIAFHGLGVSADWKRLDSDDLERHIDHVLNDARVHTNLRTMKQTFDRYETEAVAVRVIEDYLAAEAQSP